MAKPAVESIAEASLDIVEKGPTRVLHVDDELNFLKGAKQCLEIQGAFEVDAVSSVEEATEKMKKKPYDVIVCDYVMPGKDGLEFLKELREEGNNIPFIVFTGKGREEVAIKALNLGADRYFNKFGHPETVYGELAHGIHQAVKTRQAEEALRKSEERYRNLLENARDTVMTLDLNGNITYVNRVVEEYGFEKSEVIGKSMTEFVPEKYWSQLMKDFEKVLQGNIAEGEIEITTPKGTIISEYRSNPIRRGNKIIGSQTILRDITERKKTEEELLCQADLLQKTFNSMTDAIFILNAESPPKILDCNEAASTIFGYNKVEMLSNTTAFLHVNDEALKKFQSLLYPVTEKGQLYVHIPQFKMRRKDGSVFHSEHSVAQLLNNEGERIGWVSLVRDMTEHRKAEEALRQSEERLRAQYKGIPIPTYTWQRIGEDFKLVAYNDAAQVITRGKIVELLGRTVTEMYRDRPEILEDFRQCFVEKTSIKREGLFRLRSTGESRYFAISYAFVPQDLILVHTEDITERKRAEERLRDSEKRYRTLYETIKDGIVASDVDGHIVECNQAYADMLGYSKDELKKMTLQQLTPKKWHQISTERTGQLFERGYSDEYEKEYIRKDGTVFPVSIRGWLIRDKDGKPKRIWGIARDISEQKEAEEALRKSEHYLRKAQQIAHFGSWVLDVKTNRVEFSDEMFNIFGITKEQFIGTPEYTNNLVQPEDRARVQKCYEDLLIRHKPASMEYSIIRPDGSVRHLWGNGEVELDEKGNLQRLVGTVLDITERKQAEEKSKQSERRFRVAVENSPDFIVLVKRDGTIFDVNRVVKGYTREMVIGQSVFNENWYETKDQAKAARKQINHVFRTGNSGSFEYSQTAPDGSLSFYETRVAPFEHDTDGSITSVQCATRDITEHKKIEEALRESEERYRKLVELSPDTIAVHSEGKIAFINTAGSKLLGAANPEQLVGKPIMDFLHSDYRELVKRRIQQLREEGKEAPVIEEKFIRLDGTEVNVEVAAIPFTYQGKPATMAIVRDITERKKQEEDLKTTMEKLRVVGGLTRHDIRNQLFTITNNIYLAKQKLAHYNEALKYLGDIESACGLMERILDFARTYEKLGVEELTYVDVEKGIETAAFEFQDTPTIKIINDCYGLTVLADSLLGVVFYNLIHNSLKHGGKVSQIKAHYKVGKDKLKLLYEDNGVGIPKPEKEKIFKEGYGKGTGHGLYLIRKICEVYSWTIKETGKQGKGAQFAITIPKTNENGKINYQLQ